MEKVYEVRHYVDDSTSFPVCVCKSDSPWFYTCWSLGKKFDNEPKSPVDFILEGRGALEDYQMTNVDHFLVSDKLYHLLATTKAKFDTYTAIIKSRSKIISDNYKVINFVESFFCMDRELSIYTENENFPERVSRIKKLVICRAKLPEPTIFRLGENKSTLIAKEEFKVAVEKENMSGFRFCEVQLS